jgi:hypothetical protein
LVGDFVCQPNSLIAWKNRSHIGTFVHVLILFLINLVFLFPFLGYKNIFIGLILVYLSHFIEDVLKIEFSKKFPQYELIAFIWDQVFHFLAISILYLYLGHLLPILDGYSFIYRLYTNDFFIAILFTLALSSYTWDIVEYQIRRLKIQNLKYKRNYKAMFLRAFIFVSLLLLYKSVS